MPSHSHVMGYYTSDSNKIYIATGGTGSTKSTQSTGGSGSHTHSLSGTATIALNVKYTDVIICQKD